MVPEFLFEFGYILQHFALIFQSIEIKTRKNTEGVSSETILFYIIAFLCRCYWITKSSLSTYFLTYLEISLGILSLILIVASYLKYKSFDYVKATNKLPFFFSFKFLFGIVLFFSYFFNFAKRNYSLITVQMIVTSNIYSECIGIIPQLFYISKSNEKGNISLYYLIFIGLARFIRIAFWINLHLLGKTFYLLIISDIVHSIVLSIYIYIHGRNSMNSFTLPLFSGSDMIKVN